MINISCKKGLMLCLENKITFRGYYSKKLEEVDFPDNQEIMEK
jgi:hypothetical protein